MTLEDRVQHLRLYAIRRAEELGNVSATCRELGISRSLFYRWRKRLETLGPEGLHPCRLRRRRGRPPETSSHEERLVLGLSLAWPTWGPQRLADQLARQGIVIAPSTIYRILRRVGLETRHRRLGIIENHAAEKAGLLTERTRRRLLRASNGRTRHVAASEPGELVSIDSFYIGKLKGIGKIWQLTACDCATSYATARLVPAATAEHAARFLCEVLVPLYEKAGWPIQRVLTDRGSEFKGEFDRVCTELNIRHTRTKPRHPWTNGFVERLQGTILHEHWRIEFRRRFFKKMSQLENSLESFLWFYNNERPHRGYRLKGAMPASLFWGAVDEDRTL